MDYIFGHDKDRMDDYYRTMGGLEGRAVTESGLTAAQFIQNPRVRIDFKNNLSLFITNTLEIIDGDYSSQQKAMAINELKQERDYLIKQEGLIRQKKAKQYAVVDIQKTQGIMFYFVKEVGFAGGIAEVGVGIDMIGTGVALSSTGLGAVIGIPVIFCGLIITFHGFNAMQENAGAFINSDPDYKGLLSKMYEGGAEMLGYPRQYGDLVYGGVDLVTSAKGLFSFVTKPDAWRLFKYLNADLVMGFRAMSIPALTLELSADGLTIQSIQNNTPSNPRNEK